MEDLAVITALNNSDSFGKNFVKLKKKVIHKPRSVRIWKNCALCLEYRFSQYGPPGWRITYVLAPTFRWLIFWKMITPNLLPVPSLRNDNCENKTLQYFILELYFVVIPGVFLSWIY